MALTKTPICEFGKKAEKFELNSTENKLITLDDVKGKNGTLIMFICNHCPYVKAIASRLKKEADELLSHSINTIAIMSNDVMKYPDDSFERYLTGSRYSLVGPAVTTAFKFKIFLHKKFLIANSISLNFDILPKPISPQANSP